MANAIEDPSATATNPKARAPRRTGRPPVSPLRSIAIFGCVTALVAAVALPAYTALQPANADAGTVTLQSVANKDAQSLVVASEATAAPLARGTYSATTPQEIEKKKAEEAAAARAKAAAAAAAASVRTTSGGSRPVSTAGMQMVAPGSGAVRYPLVPGSYYVSRTTGSGHQGADMVLPSGNPIFAATGGVVRVSSEGYYGYGVAVIIDSVVGGRTVSTLYGHMTYGSRLVSSGQTVAPGQQIGQVGNTGQSYGSHLHFEVHINGSITEPIGWLAANAG